MWMRSLLLVLALGLGSPVSAHDPGLSSLTLRLHHSRLDGLMTFAPADLASVVRLDLNRDGVMDDAEFEEARPGLEKLAAAAADVEVAGRAIAPTRVAVGRYQLSGKDNLQIALSYPVESNGLLVVRSGWLGQMPSGHRQYATVWDGSGKVRIKRLLDAARSAIEVDLAALDRPTSSSRDFWAFLVLGIEHIVTGYDHLIFLFGLLIVGKGFAPAAKIITSFTLAHSITLALGAVGWVRVPAEIVEPLIAASIVYVGLENLQRGEGRRRWLLTFVFGLVHGLGFASVLQETLPGVGLVVPLLSFNLGVEVGQVAITALLLPLLWIGQRRQSYSLRYAPLCSLLVTLAGAYWLVQRTLL